MIPHQRQVCLVLLLIVQASRIVCGQTPEYFRAGDGREGAATGYFAQPADGGKLVLDANNGFFDPGDFVAVGQRDAASWDREFIGKHFDALQVGAADASARWHVWIAEPGTLLLETHFAITDEDAGSVWEMRIGEQRQSFVAGTGQRLTFQIEVAGKVTVSLRKSDSKRTPKARLLSVTLSGPAIKKAKLLRVRWRPSAVHAAFQASTCDEATIWVFETKSLNPASSYSPLTTPFGYFGTTFGEGRNPRGFNFSMWAAKASDQNAPPLNTMPHLIATGNPNADFSGFGHEGSGVKLRGWDCLNWNPGSVVQALRIDPNGGNPIYYGYFFDEPNERWVLYAAGIKPRNRRAGLSGFDSVGSFCEVPGPPQVQRTGDVERTIARRGWLYGTDQQWHRVDTISTRDKQTSSARSVAVGDDGWLLSHAGGIELVDVPQQAKLRRTETQATPKYLEAETVDQLFELPVEFGEHEVGEITSHSGEVRYHLERLGEDAMATLHYGPVDCLTFVSRSLHATENKGASRTFYTDDRTWAFKTLPQPAVSGVNRFRLTGLNPDSDYYFRVFVTHKTGKSWAYESGQFRTRP